MGAAGRSVRGAAHPEHLHVAALRRADERGVAVLVRGVLQGGRRGVEVSGEMSIQSKAQVAFDGTCWQIAVCNLVFLV